MADSDFKTLEQAITAFTLQISETRGLISAQPVPPSSFPRQAFDRELDWAIAVGGEKAQSEGIIAQILLEVREQRHRQVSQSGFRDSLCHDRKSGFSSDLSKLTHFSDQMIEIRSQ